MSQDHASNNGWVWANDKAKLEKQWERGIWSTREILDMFEKDMSDDEKAKWYDYLNIIDECDAAELA